MTASTIASVDSVLVMYARYFGRYAYRSKGQSIGLPIAEWLGTWIRRVQPARILDLGSGFSTLLLRSLTRSHGGEVVTTDNAARWLARSMEELEGESLPTTGMYLQCDHAKVAGLFDLVLLDLGAPEWAPKRDGTEARVACAPLIARWLAPTGIVILDDWHRPEYAVRMTLALAREGIRVRPMSETRDEFGRFAALAEWDR